MTCCGSLQQGARRSVSFISAYSNPFTGSVQIRYNPFFTVPSVFYFYETTPHQYGLASCACGTPFGEQTVLPLFYFPLRLRAFA